MTHLQPDPPRYPNFQHSMGDCPLELQPDRQPCLARRSLAT